MGSTMLGQCYCILPINIELNLKHSSNGPRAGLQRGRVNTGHLFYSMQARRRDWETARTQEEGGGARECSIDERRRSGEPQLEAEAAIRAASRVDVISNISAIRSYLCGPDEEDGLPRQAWQPDAAVCMRAHGSGQAESAGRTGCEERQPSSTESCSRRRRSCSGLRRGSPGVTVHYYAAELLPTVVRNARCWDARRTRVRLEPPLEVVLGRGSSSGLSGASDTMDGRAAGLVGAAER